MIFVMVGTTYRSFNRLIEAIDNYACLSGDKIIIQVGHSTFKPKFAEYFKFKSHNEITSLIASAQLIITHGGYGCIFDSIRQKKKIIAVPRDRLKNETKDPGDGQYELVRYLEKKKMILALYDVSQLNEYVEKAKMFNPFFENNNCISSVIRDIIRKEEENNNQQKMKRLTGFNIFRNALPLFLKNKLIEMTFFVTDRCNYKCKHCFMLDKLNTKQTDFLSLKEIQLMGNSISSMQRVHIAGGEPMLRNDISDIILEISNNWNTQIICLPTNGSFQKNAERSARMFGEHGKNHLRFHFSLSAMGDSMDSFTGHNKSFYLWEKTVKQVKKITNNYKNIALTVLTTFNDFNQDNINNLIDYVNKILKPDDFSFGLVRSHSEYNPKLNLDTFEYINHKFHSENSAHNPFIRAYRELIRNKVTQYNIEKRYYVDCQSGRLRVVMSPDGDIFPCETLGYPEGANQDVWNMGNIRDFNYNITKLLRGEKAKAIKKLIKDNKCHCAHGIDQAINYLCTWKFKFEVILLGLKYVFRIL